jgi:arsenate reductase
MSISPTRRCAVLPSQTDPVRGDQRASLASAQSALVDEFSGTFAPETVADCLADSYERLLPASIDVYLPLLAQRFARERLRAATRSVPGDDTRVRRAPLVLFVCTANSGRSQLAAALVTHRSAGLVETASAGTTPGTAVQEEVLVALEELGIDGADLFPKPLTDEVVAGADVVVTMGCGDSCPVLPGRRYLDWGIADPAGRGLEAVRAIRDDIDARVTELLDGLRSVDGAYVAPHGT